MPALPVYPFEASRLIGTLSEITATTAKANFPTASQADGRWLYGNKMGGGQVGEFVAIECGTTVVFGRIVSLRLPERERLSVEPEYGEHGDAHPVGSVQLLTSVSLGSAEILGGIQEYPRIGARVFSAHPQLIKWVAEYGQHADSARPIVSFRLATLGTDDDTSVEITPERLVGRHCAVLGATGGGKSWTLARILEEASRFNAKIILVDATGEFHTLTKKVKHVYIGTGVASPPGAEEVVLPHRMLVENDLFALFRPSGQAQVPKLRSAIKTLKLVQAEQTLTTRGVFVKAEAKRAAYDQAMQAHAATINSDSADFAIEHLSNQVFEECVWPSGGSKQFPDYTKWGGSDDGAKSYCVSLVARIEDLIHANELTCIFNPGNKPPLFKVIDEFLKDTANVILRISLKNVPFSHDAREIIVNAIGRRLLHLARTHTFKDGPLLVCLDEAHHFLNKTIQDDYTKYPLDSFDLIAKEGRKFGLVLCMATQRPRDLPEAVLSQIGTLIVHRLTNDKDREVVERASGDIDRSAASFLPSLGPGEAALIGVEFSMPVTIQVVKPSQKPDSKGPDFQKRWKLAELKASRAAGG